MDRRWLSMSRWSWFAVVGVLLAGKDACLGGGKRPEPRPEPAPTTAPSTAPSGTSGFATPPPPTPLPRPVPPG